MAIPTVIGASHVHHDETSNDGTWEVPIPAGSAGDLIIVHLGVLSGADYGNASYTTLFRLEDSGGNLNCDVSARISTGDETNPTIFSAGSNQQGQADVFRVSGVKSTIAEAAPSGERATAQSTGATGITVPSFNTVERNTLILAFSFANSSTDYNTPSDYNYLYGENYSNPLRSSWCGWKIQYAPGAVGSTTMSLATGTSRHAGGVVAIRGEQSNDLIGMVGV